MTQQQQQLTAEERERRAEERRQRIQAFVQDLASKEDMPWVPMLKPLSESRLALVTTGGFYIPPQPPFDIEERRSDPSFRAIPSDADPSTFSIAHGHYDTTDAEEDVNVLFPVDRVRELQSEGMIGEVAPTHYSFAGFIQEPAHLVEVTAPEVARQLQEAQVDAVLLTPA